MNKLVRLYLLMIVVGLPGIAPAVPNGILDTANRFDYVGLVDNGSGLGSGVLLSANVVLTAGHVATGSGFNFYTWDGNTNTYQSVGVSSTVVHPNYAIGDFSSYQYDVALLFLDAPVSLSSYAILNPEPMAGLVGEAVTVAGFGGDLRRHWATETLDSVTGNILQTVSTNPFVEGGDSGGGLSGV